MKHLIIACLFLFGFSVTAQVLDPIDWSHEVNKISDDEYELIVNADFEPGWHIYSQFLEFGEDEIGPIPTEVEFFETDGNYELVGKTSEPETKPVFDKAFGMEISYFGGQTQFKQRIKLINKDLTAVKGAVSFQVCDDTRCLAPDTKEFVFTLKAEEKRDVFEPVKWTVSSEKLSDTQYNLIYKASIIDKWHLYSQNLPEGGALPTEFIYDSLQLANDFKLIDKAQESESVTEFDKVFEMDLTYFDNEATFTQKIELLNPDLKFIKSEIYFQACDDKKCIFESEEALFNLDGQQSAVAKGTVSLEDIKKSSALSLDIKGKENYEQEEVGKKSNFKIFLLGFLGGLIALLTPCVFPMIPLTVSFFTKSGANSQQGMANSIMYGVFIFVIYVLLSLPFHLIDSLDPEILNNISTNVTLNILFFLVFIFFAFSFFGYYELTLPSSWGTKLDSKATKIGGLVGVFLMALTLAIVSFSCTGPILGTLLGSTALSTGDVATKLTMGLAGFGLALALPFTLFAMFPKWLNSLPKSGGWLNTVKVVLGFIELALAFKFLSNADLVEQWGLLKREIFIGIWIVVAILTALYLFGKIKFPHDSPLQKLSFSRISFGILFVAIAIYLLPGLTNTEHANLKLLSGIAPPLNYSIYDKPDTLEIYKTIDEGLAAAKEKNKPIMLDFTGWACVNCRKMEENVWTSPIVKEYMEAYVIISLYVDERKELGESDKFKYLKANGSIKNIKTVGDKWATLQTVNFNNNSQPYYVLLNTNMELLNSPIAYTPEDTDYSNWLKTGIENFEKFFPNK